MSNLIQSSPLWTFMNLNVYFLLMVYFQPYPIKPTVDLYEPFCVLSSLDKCPTLSNQVHCAPVWIFLITFLSLYISNLIRSRPLLTFMNLSVFFHFVTAQLGPRENMVMNSESIDFCGGLAAILFFQLWIYERAQLKCNFGNLKCSNWLYQKLIGSYNWG